MRGTPSISARTNLHGPRCRQRVCRGTRASRSRRSRSHVDTQRSGADWVWWPDQSSKLFGPRKGLGRFDSYTLPPPFFRSSPIVTYRFTPSSLLGPIRPSELILYTLGYSRRFPSDLAREAHY